MNFGELFDRPWTLLILVLLLIIFFGSRKLPDAARSLGKSMRILKTEVQGMHHEGDTPAASTTTTAQAAAPAQIETKPQSDAQDQIDALQKQLNDLKAKQS